MPAGTSLVRIEGMKFSNSGQDSLTVLRISVICVLSSFLPMISAIQVSCGVALSRTIPLVGTLRLRRELRAAYLTRFWEKRPRMPQPNGSLTGLCAIFLAWMSTVELGATSFTEAGGTSRARIL
jgi:hypothetical protein